MDEKPSFGADSASRLARLLGVEPLARREARPLVGLWLLFSVLAVALRILFWAYSHRVFDDGMIVLQYAENAAQGLGLTHHVSEPRIQGFTSPLGVLIPLAGELAHRGAGLASMRLASLAAVVLALMYIAALAAHTRLAWPFAAFAMGYAAVEHHQIFYGMAGLETQLLLAILLMSLYYAVTGHSLWLGVSVGLCLLARPDYVLWAAIAVLAAAFRGWRACAAMLAAAAAVYGPWFLFAWLYYGSPVPNTVVAKALVFPQWWLDPGLTWMGFKRNVVERALASFSMLVPSWNAYPFPGYRPLMLTVLAVAALGAASTLRRGRRPLLLLVAVWGVYTAYAVFLVRYRCPHYLVPLMALTTLLCAYGLETILRPMPRSWPSLAATGLAILYLGCLGMALRTTFEADRCVQAYIEEGVRKPIGVYLREAVKPDEAFTCESVGYFGYCSRKTSYDWPGLTSRVVTDYLRRSPDGRGLSALCEHFRPAYLVLRPSEYRTCQNGRRGNWIDEAYVLDKTFEVAPGAGPGWLYNSFDAKFLVFRRK